MQFIIRHDCTAPNIDLRDLSKSELADLAEIVMNISSSLSQHGLKLVVKSKQPAAPKQRQLSEQN